MRAKRNPAMPPIDEWVEEHCPLIEAKGQRKTYRELTRQFYDDWNH